MPNEPPAASPASARELELLRAAIQQHEGMIRALAEIVFGGVEAVARDPDFSRPPFDLFHRVQERIALHVTAGLAAMHDPDTDSVDEPTPYNNGLLQVRGWFDQALTADDGEHG